MFAGNALNILFSHDHANIHRYIQGGHSPGKPGKVREFESGQGKVRENGKSQGKVRGD